VGLNKIWEQFFYDSNLTVKKITAYLNLSLCLLRGMGVQTITKEEPSYYIELIDLWRYFIKNLKG